MTNNQQNQQIVTALEGLIDIDLKSMSEQEIVDLRGKIGRAVCQFYTLANIEIKRKKKV